jgi:hypothetical protein
MGCGFMGVTQRAISVEEPMPKNDNTSFLKCEEHTHILFNIINFFHKDKLESTLINSHLMASAGKSAVQIT